MIKMLTKALGFLTALFFLIFAGQLSAKTLIISDIDDTIKMTDILGAKSKILFNTFFKPQAFAGMSELYQGFNQEETIIHYVSGSPKIIRKKVTKFLVKNNFPQNENLTLRDSVFDHAYDFKYNSIKKILDLVKPDKVILIGDDTEFDPDVYHQIALDHPELVRGIYIRTIQKRELINLSGIKTFFAPIEIALSEVLEKRYEFSNLKNLTESFINQSNKAGIAIKNRYCPEDGRIEVDVLNFLVGNEEIDFLLKQTQEKIAITCRMLIKKTETNQLSHDPNDQE